MSGDGIGGAFIVRAKRRAKRPQTSFNDLQIRCPDGSDPQRFNIADYKLRFRRIEKDISANDSNVVKVSRNGQAVIHPLSLIEGGELLSGNHDDDTVQN